jgi:hypothetical protein
MPVGTRAQSALRAARAWEHAQMGKTENQIVALLEEEGLGKVTQPGVHKMLSKIRQRLFEELRDKAEHQKSQQTATLHRILAEAMEAWAKSWKPNKTLTSKQGGGAPQDASVTIRDGTGDPRYLQAAMAALADIRVIWGLDEAKKVKHGGDAEAAPIKHEVEANLDGATLDELLRLREIYDGIAARRAQANGDASGQPASAR